MARPAVSLANELIGHLRYLENTRVKVEKLLSTNDIVHRDIEQVYSGLYLDAITSFERFIEHLFIGLLAGRIEFNSSEVICRVSFKSDLIARDVVSGGRPYVDWLPYENTEKLAKVFFRNGLPFTRLQPAEKNQINNILLVIRNAIAHKSKHASKRFEEQVISSMTLMPREKTPAGFLRSIFRSAPIQTRYENLIAEMAAMALKLCG